VSASPLLLPGGVLGYTPSDPFLDYRFGREKKARLARLCGRAGNDEEKGLAGWGSSLLRSRAFSRSENRTG